MHDRELHPQQSNLSVVRAILCRDVYWTGYVRTVLLISEFRKYSHYYFQISNLFEQWACGSLQTVRVFTDQWPDCTCVVMFYQFDLPGK